MIIKLTIQNNVDKNSIVLSLANAGYKVWVEEPYFMHPVYYICFEYKDITIAEETGVNRGEK